MLSELRLRNFKAFGDEEQKAPMSKITLIYGPNSGGKSSIIQALLMLKQSLDRKWSKNRRSLMPRGEYVDLGSFSALLHKHATANRELGISIKFLAHTQKTGVGVQMTFVEPEPQESATKDSSFLSEVRYQILDRNSLLLDAKLKYKSNENSWDMSRLVIANNNNREMFSKIKNCSNGFLPTLELQAEERILKLRRQYTRELGQQQKLELELIAELILELIRKLELQRKLIQMLKLLPEPGCTQELGEKLGKKLGKKLGQKLRLELEPEQAQKLGQKLGQQRKKEGEWALIQNLTLALALEDEQDWEWALREGLIQELIWGLIWAPVPAPMQEQGQELEELKPLLARLGPFAQYLEENILEQIPAQIPDLVQELELVHILMLDIEPEKILDITPTDIPLSYNDLLNSITYLGPLRSYPERLYTVSGWNRDSVGVQGEFTTHILYHDAIIAEEVNKWFERFEIPYRLEIRESGDVQLAGKYVSIALIDKNTNTPVTLADVGFGINQLLPIITEGLTPEENEIICVEQPEIHLHPRLQANIADLMIDTIRDEKGKQKQWIVETHSELLIRRIQRRIREGVLNPNDVSVLYVNPGDEGSKIEVLELDEDGDFTNEWPHGFFDEGFNELMAE